MKKLRVFLLSVAVVTAVGAAFATSARQNCVAATQYKKVGPNTYWPAGMYGVNYACLSGATVCTYYKPNPIVESYAPCRWGTFTPIP